MSSPEIQDLLAKGIRAARQDQNEAAERIFQQVVAADDQNELAWMWLARVSSSGSDQAACLERVVGLNPNNKWAAHYLAVVNGEVDENEDPFASPTERRQVEVLKCPNCGGATKLKNEASKTVVCQYCDSVIDLTPAQAAVVGRKNNISAAQPIEPGMEATFDGKQYLVVGWLRFKGFDDEDVWFWDEWLLVGKAGSVLWLSYDNEEGFMLNEKIPLDKAFDPRSARKIPVPDGNASIKERGEARIRGIAGELTWKAKIGEPVSYIEAEKGRQGYSVEYTRDEIELYKGTEIDEEAVWTAFGRDDLVNAMRAAKSKGLVDKRGRPKKSKAQVVLMAVLLLTFLASIAGVGYSLFSGKEIYSGNANLRVGQSQTIGPVPLSMTGRPHKLSLRSSRLPKNTWASVVVDITTPSQQTFPVAGESFWHETGYDSDGHWDESDYSESTVFRPVAAGEHYLKVSLPEAKGVNDLTVTAKVKEGVVLMRYFVITGILSMIFIAIFSKKTED